MTDEKKLEELVLKLSQKVEEVTTNLEILATQKSIKMEWLDNQDVMEKLHLSVRTLQNWRDQGIIPFSKIGKKIYYLESDVEELLNSNLQNKAS